MPELSGILSAKAVVQVPCRVKDEDSYIAVTYNPGKFTIEFQQEVLSLAPKTGEDGTPEATPETLGQYIELMAQ